MILTIEAFKKHLIKQQDSILEYQSGFEYDIGTYSIYAPEQILLDIKKEFKSLDNSVLNVRSSKNYLEGLLKRISKIPLATKINVLRAFILLFAGTISMPEINVVIDTSAKNKIVTTIEASELKSSLIDMYKKVTTEYVMPTEFSDTLVEFLKHEEGVKGKAVLTAYDIGDGMITIGYGHAERKSKTDMVAKVTKITEEQAEDLLVKDIMEAQRGVDKILRDWKANGIKFLITQNQYDAMISMTYNMGIGNMRKSDFIQLVKSGKLEEASKKIQTTNVTYPGHVKRRKKESFLFNAKNDVQIDTLLNIT